MESSWALKINIKPWNDREETWTHWLSDKSQSEKAAFSMSPTPGLSGKGTTMETVKKKKISGCQGLGSGRDEQVEHGGFLGQ